MIVRTFDFIPFEEWLKTKRFNAQVGDYTCAITSLINSSDDKKQNVYQAIISNSFSPQSKYAHTLFEDSICCEIEDDAMLKNWYDSITVKLNDRWEQFVLDTYMLDN